MSKTAADHHRKASEHSTHGRNITQRLPSITIRGSTKRRHITHTQQTLTNVSLESTLVKPLMPTRMSTERNSGSGIGK
jgi:hypothetical protein